LRLLFPGFFTEQPIHSYEIKMETANLMDAVKGRLEDDKLTELTRLLALWLGIG